jgi:hypothetical protein
MKPFLSVLAVSLLAAPALVGCGADAGDASSSNDQAIVSGAPSVTGRDFADSQCRVVLRYSGVSGISGGEVFFDPTTHESWVRYRAVVDVDTRLVEGGGTVGLFYSAQSQSSGIMVEAINSHDDPADPALANPGAGLENLHGGQDVPAGFTRFALATTTNTFRAGDSGQPALQMIPFVRLPDGKTFWDHNKNPLPTANYDLDAAHEFHILDDFGVCRAPDREDPIL